jgi:hypothetical protein
MTVLSTAPLRRSLSRTALIALTAGISLGASFAHAAIVDSGPVNIPIPDNIDGVYLNVITGVSGSTGGSVPGWDINPYSATAGGFHLWGPTANTWFTPDGVIGGNYNLPVGTVIQGPATAFFRPGGGTNIAPQVNLNSSNNYFGFRFTNESGSTNHFGYIQVQFGATAGTRAIVRYVYESTPDTAITVAPPGPPNVPPQFGYTPAPSSTVTATGGTGIIGSTSNLSIAVSVATAGSGTGAPATTTLTCTAPTAPFAGFGQTVTATGSGAISGGPLSGTCTRGATAVTQTLTCSENQGGTPVARTWTLNCPAGTAPVATVPVDATSVWSLIALMLALFGFAAVAARRQG